MGIAGIKIKIMPTSPEVNIEKLKQEIRELVEREGGRNRDYEIEPIAFGLKAIIAFFEWPEEKELENLEEHLNNLENVNSIQIIDMRKIS
jgi:elongation factor 1-beta